MRTQADPDRPGGTSTVPASRRPAEPPAAALTDDPDLPFRWESTPAQPPRELRQAVFRFPTGDDPEPDAGRLLGLAAWATGLGLFGLMVAIRGLLAIVGGTAPGWYQPTLVAGGLAGIALTVCAFLSVHRARLPWLMLAAATVPLVVNLVVTARAL